MSAPIDAVVIGFTRSPVLMEKSFAPLCRLRQEGVLRSINYVTWDSPEVDPCLAPLAGMPDVFLTRVPQPQVQGLREQRGLVCQVENLAAAMRLLPRDNSLVLKWRPDVVAQYSFLRDKLLTVDSWNRIEPPVCFGVQMPQPAFQKKFWIPWADSNNFFYLDDSVFLGTRSDVKKLVIPITAADLDTIGTGNCTPYAHVVRYATPFLARYPLFRNYVQRYRLFRHELEFRYLLVQYGVDDGFFWHMLVAHAWILHSHFHVDIGAQGDMAFYANAVNLKADWSKFDTLRTTNPYDRVESWRQGTRAGSALPSVSRAYGRLMDDAWQKALFTQEMPDLPRDMLIAMMENIAGCTDGRFHEIEADFYRKVEDVNRSFDMLQLAS
jgi:hypothetical protein